jgi:hypothetical protein
MRNVFGGGDGDSPFPRERFTDLPVQKEAHLNGFLRLGDLNLPQALPAQGFAQGIPDFPFGREGHPDVQLLMVGNHGDHVQPEIFFHREMREVLIEQALAKLHFPLPPEVVKDHVIAVPESSNGFPLRIHQDPGFQSLIILPRLIGRPDRPGHRIFTRFFLQKSSPPKFHYRSIFSHEIPLVNSSLASLSPAAMGNQKGLGKLLINFLSRKQNANWVKNIYKSRSDFSGRV